MREPDARLCRIAGWWIVPAATIADAPVSQNDSSDNYCGARGCGVRGCRDAQRCTYTHADHDAKFDANDQSDFNSDCGAHSHANCISNANTDNDTIWIGGRLGLGLLRPIDSSQCCQRSFRNRY